MIYTVTVDGRTLTGRDAGQVGQWRLWAHREGKPVTVRVTGVGKPPA